MRSGVDQSTLTRVCRKSSFQANFDTESGQLSLLGKFVEIDSELKGFCRYHISRLAAKLGLKTQCFSGEIIAKRLQQYWRNRGDVTAFKLDFTTSLWWRRASRPAFETDSLGVHSKRPMAEETPFSLSQEHARVIMEAILPGAYSNFADDGNIVLKNFFGYL